MHSVVQFENYFCLHGMATEVKTLDNETADPPKIIQYECRKMGVIFRIQQYLHEEGLI